MSYCSSAKSERNGIVSNATHSNSSDSNLKCTENQLNKRVLAVGANGTGRLENIQKSVGVLERGKVLHFIKHQLNVRFSRQKHAYLN